MSGPANAHLEHEVVGVKRAVAIMSDWPAGRVRRAIKLGAPKSGKGVRPVDVRAWAAEQEKELAIRPTSGTSAGWVVPVPVGPWLSRLVSELTDKRRDAWESHVCMAWPTARDRLHPTHYRVREKGSPQRLLIACGRCLEVRLSVRSDKAWPVTIVPPEAP